MTDNEVRTLMDKVEKILIAQAEMRADLKAMRDESSNDRQVHDDHETRLRTLERVSWKVAGAWAVIGSGAYAGLTQILNFT